MGAFDDMDLERTEVWTAPSKGPGYRRWIVGVVVATLLVAAGLTWWMRTRPTLTTAQKRMADSVAPVAPPAGGTPTPAAPLPPLDALDPVIRRLVGELTSSPALARWLATDNLARQVAALVEAADDPRLSLRMLAPLRPGGAFSVVERRGRMTIAPESYARYDALADVIAALDPVAVARVYTTLAPRLDDAHGELGDGERTFDEALRDGLRRLAETPIPDGPVAVTTRGGVYMFADPRLEALTPAEKLLLRSGPANARRVQAQLAAIAAALGPPATR